MAEEVQSFEAFMKTRQTVAQAYVQGDSTALAEIVARVLPATFFGPGGGHREGTEIVAAAYARDAESFEPGGETHLEVLHQGASEGIGYWVGFQHAKAKLRGDAKLKPMKLRVTEVFRREGQDWKLVHRHADLLSEAQRH